MAKQNQIINLPNLGVNNLENMFQVNIDIDGNYYYDLTETIYFDEAGANPSNYTIHTLTEYDNLYSISSKYYGSRTLWWIIGVTNNIDNPFTIRDNVGDEIKILSPNVVGNILSKLKA